MARKKKRKSTTVRTLAGLGLLLAGLYYIGRRTVAKVSIGAAAVRVHKITLQSIELRVDLPVINESDIPVSVTGFLGQIFYLNSAIGTLDLVNQVPIPGFGQAVVPIRANIGVVSAGTTVFDILKSKKIDWGAFTVRGTLKVAGIPVDVDQKLLSA